MRWTDPTRIGSDCETDLVMKWNWFFFGSGRNTLQYVTNIHKTSWARYEFKHFEWPMSLKAYFQKCSRACYFFLIKKLTRISRPHGNPVYNVNIWQLTHFCAREKCNLCRHCNTIHTLVFSGLLLIICFALFQCKKCIVFYIPRFPSSYQSVHTLYVNEPVPPVANCSLLHQPSRAPCHTECHFKQCCDSLRCQWGRGASREH